MTTDELLAADFTMYSPGLHKYADACYQLRVRDARGTRYFITVTHYKNYEYEGSEFPELFAVDVHFSKGCKWFPSEQVLACKIYGRLAEWTVQQLIDAAAELWDRLNPQHYELVPLQGIEAWAPMPEPKAMHQYT